MNHKRISLLGFSLLFFLIGWMNMKEISAEETTMEEVVTLEETTEEQTTEGQTGTIIEPITEEKTTEVTTSKEGTTKIPAGYMPPKKNQDSVVNSESSAVAKSVVTVVSLSKKGKKQAKLYIYSEGKYKTKKTKLVVRIQMKKNGTWSTYRTFQKAKKSFYCIMKKKFRLRGKCKYRADVTVYYYNKKKKKIGKHRKKSKIILT